MPFPAPFPFLLTEGDLLLSSCFPNWAFTLQEKDLLRQEPGLCLNATIS
jgi:hypothetical protein